MQTAESKKASKTTTPSTKDDYVLKLEAQGKEWDAQLALWGAKAEKASAEIKADFHKWQRDFQGKRGDVHKKIEALRTAKNEAWEEMKTGVDSGWNEVKSAYESAMKKFS